MHFHNIRTISSRSKLIITIIRIIYRILNILYITKSYITSFEYQCTQHLPSSNMSSRKDNEIILIERIRSFWRPLKIERIVNLPYDNLTFLKSNYDEWFFLIQEVIDEKIRRWTSSKILSRSHRKNYDVNQTILERDLRQKNNIINHWEKSVHIECFRISRNDDRWLLSYSRSSSGQNNHMSFITRWHVKCRQINFEIHVHDNVEVISILCLMISLILLLQKKNTWGILDHQKIWSFILIIDRRYKCAMVKIWESW